MTDAEKVEIRTHWEGCWKDPAHHGCAVKEVERLLERDAEWERKASAWMASPEAAQRLDGYRELAQKLNVAEAEVERLRVVIEAAPHDEDCQSVINTGPITRYGVATCNCWKAARGES